MPAKITSLESITIKDPVIQMSSENQTYTLTLPAVSENTKFATEDDLSGYAPVNHNHDTTYASKTHNHDGVYAAANHTHSNYLTEHQSLTSCVKTSGNETIAGVKTFSSAPKLSSNTITNSSGKTITLPSAAGTLATTSHNHDSVYAPISHTHSEYLTEHQPLTSCVKTSGNETIAGVKTFSSAPKLSTNTITRSDGATITLPSDAGTLALTSAIPTDYVKTSTNQTIAGVKTFSSTPKLSTNKITNSSGKTITLPSTAGTLLIEASGIGPASTLMQSIINAVYPVGSIIIRNIDYFHNNIENASPGNTFTWQRWYSVGNLWEVGLESFIAYERAS